MQKWSLYFVLIAMIVAGISINSCTKKVSGIDNNQVIETPYSLFFSDTAGAMYSSNDGKTIRATIFKPDGYPCRAICTDGNNILWAKSTLRLSTNNGVNFNQAFDSLTSYPFISCDSIVRDLNQSMLINIPDWHMTFTVSNNPDASNYLGVVYSLYGGAAGSWWGDLPDSIGNIGAYTGNYPINMTSYTLLTNGTLCGYDGIHNRNFYRSKITLWNECTANPDSFSENVGTPGRRWGTRLPHRAYHYAISGLTSSDTFSFYSYGHYNNRLIAIDNRACNNGAYYSDDTGRNWTQYAGLPAAPLMCVASPFEEICLIGTDGAGLYFLNNNTGAFQLQTNNGLGTNIIIRNIAFKKNIYKDGSTQKYVYLATNQGIYQSTDGGYHWTKTIKGNFVAIY